MEVLAWFCVIDQQPHTLSLVVFDAVVEGFVDGRST